MSIGMYTPPGPPGASNAGSLNAFVTVAPGNTSSGGGVIGTPEPSTLTLAALVFPGVGLAGWRKWDGSWLSPPSFVA